MFRKQLLYYCIQFLLCHYKKESDYRPKGTLSIPLAIKKKKSCLAPTVFPTALTG